MSDVAVHDKVLIQSTADVNFIGQFIQDNSALSICVPRFLRSPELCRPAYRRLPRPRPDSPSPPPCCPPLNVVVLLIVKQLFFCFVHKLPTGSPLNAVAHEDRVCDFHQDIVDAVHVEVSACGWMFRSHLKLHHRKSPDIAELKIC